MIYYNMDIRKYFASSSSKSGSPSREVSTRESQDDPASEVPPIKRPCAVRSSVPTSRNYNKNWEKYFPWLSMTAISKVHFANYAERMKPVVGLHKKVDVYGSLKLPVYSNQGKSFQNGKRQSKNESTCQQ